MDKIKPIRVQFRLERQSIDHLIERSWTIGKIKGKIRKLFKINPYYDLQLIYQGSVLENKRKFQDINYLPGSIIKVMATHAAEL